MPKIKLIPNPLYGAETEKLGIAGSFSTPEITQVSFKPGELNREERKHSKLTARASFINLLWYAQEMIKSKCSYREAVIKVLKQEVKS